MGIITKKTEIGFTDDKITTCGGSVFLSQTTFHPGFPHLVDTSPG